MAGACLGRGMALIARGEHRAGQQPREAVGEMVAVLREQVGRELVHRDRDDQLGRRARRGGRGSLAPWRDGRCGGRSLARLARVLRARGQRERGGKEQRGGEGFHEGTLVQS